MARSRTLYPLAAGRRAGRRIFLWRFYTRLTETGRWLGLVPASVMRFWRQANADQISTAQNLGPPAPVGFIKVKDRTLTQLAERFIDCGLLLANGLRRARHPMRLCGYLGPHEIRLLNTCTDHLASDCIPATAQSDMLTLSRPREVRVNYLRMQRANAGPGLLLHAAVWISPVLEMVIVPPGHVTETNFSPTLHSSLQSLPVSQLLSSLSACRPPAGPGGPARPAGPAGPCGPCSPFAP